MPQAKRTPVGTPLSPSVLYEMGAIHDLQIFDEPFDPNASYTNTYRIWLCHGYRERGNGDRGLLKVSRTISTEPDRFTLEITQNVVNDKGVLHTFTASILCRNDTLATPEQWALTSDFTGPDGLSIPDLRSEERYTSGDTIPPTNRYSTSQMSPESTAYTSDWCLFDALQRMPLEVREPLHFTLLEELSKSRTNQQLSFRSHDTWNVQGKVYRCPRFSHWGTGLLPHDYWLMPSHRLAIATTLSVAYILDSEAEKSIQRVIDAQRARSS